MSSFYYILRKNTLKWTVEYYLYVLYLVRKCQIHFKAFNVFNSRLLMPIKWYFKIASEFYNDTLVIYGMVSLIRLARSYWSKFKKVNYMYLKEVVNNYVKG